MNSLPENAHLTRQRLPTSLKLRRSDTTPTYCNIDRDRSRPANRTCHRSMFTKRPDSKTSFGSHRLQQHYPGGDPIAAALAAGETPSPEMVAAAPKEGALRPYVAVICLAGLVACLLFQILVSSKTRVERSHSDEQTA